MARRYDSEAARKRILSASVRLFLERGYHGTTMAAILKNADVSASTFQTEYLRHERWRDVRADEAYVLGPVLGCR